MTEIYEDMLRFENDDPVALVGDIRLRAGQIVKLGGTIHEIHVDFEDAQGSAEMIVTMTERQALALGYEGDDLVSLRQQRVQSDVS